MSLCLLLSSLHWDYVPESPGLLLCVGLFVFLSALGPRQKCPECLLLLWIKHKATPASLNPLLVWAAGGESCRLRGRMQPHPSSAQGRTFLAFDLKEKRRNDKTNWLFSGLSPLPSYCSSRPAACPADTSYHLPQIIWMISINQLLSPLLQQFTLGRFLLLCQTWSSACIS